MGGGHLIIEPNKHCNIHTQYPTKYTTLHALHFTLYITLHTQDSLYTRKDNHTQPTSYSTNHDHTRTLTNYTVVIKYHTRTMYPIRDTPPTDDPQWSSIITSV